MLTPPLLPVMKILENWRTGINDDRAKRQHKTWMVMVRVFSLLLTAPVSFKSVELCKQIFFIKSNCHVFFHEIDCHVMEHKLI